MTYKVFKFKLINTILEDLSSAGRWHSWKDPSSFPKKKKNNNNIRGIYRINV